MRWMCWLCPLLGPQRSACNLYHQQHGHDLIACTVQSGKLLCSVSVQLYLCMPRHQMQELLTIDIL